MFYAGSCNKRRGYYGDRIFYNSLQPNNGNFYEVFREKISSIPFLSKFDNIKIISIIKYIIIKIFIK